MFEIEEEKERKRYPDTRAEFTAEAIEGNSKQEHLMGIAAVGGLLSLFLFWPLAFVLFPIAFFAAVLPQMKTPQNPGFVGPCPACSKEVTMTLEAEVVNCWACNSRVIREGRIYSVI